MLPDTHQYHVPQTPQDGMPLWAKLLLGIAALVFVSWLLFPKQQKTQTSAATPAEKNAPAKTAEQKAAEKKAEEKARAEKEKAAAEKEKAAAEKEKAAAEKEKREKEESDKKKKESEKRAAEEVAKKQKEAEASSTGTPAPPPSAPPPSAPPPPVPPPSEAEAAPPPSSASSPPVPPAEPSSRPRDEEIISHEHIANLSLTIYPTFSANGTTLEQTIKNIAAISPRYDPDKRGFRIVLSDKLPAAVRNRPVNVTIRKKTIEVLLDIVCQQTGTKWHVRNGVVEIIPTVKGS
jgi:flagellar biosynthesis GTPase FlhF